MMVARKQWITAPTMFSFRAFGDICFPSLLFLKKMYTFKQVAIKSLCEMDDTGDEKTHNKLTL